MVTEVAWTLLRVVKNTTQAKMAAKQKTYLGKKLQQNWEMQVASPMLTSDLTSKLDKQKDERVMVKMIKDIPQVQPLVMKKGDRRRSVNQYRD